MCSKMRRRSGTMGYDSSTCRQMTNLHYGTCVFAIMAITSVMMHVHVISEVFSCVVRVMKEAEMRIKRILSRTCNIALLTVLTLKVF